jgi:sugar/nucleoside kinase (ribokinase family)
VSYDVACLGRPFLDLVLTGLPRLPAPGSELSGDDLHVSPGGIANVALGLTRLGLRTALLSPRGSDFAGREVARMLTAEGVDWLGPEHPRGAVTIALPIEGERTMMTFDPGNDAPQPAELEALSPRAVVGDHPWLSAPGARRYVGAGYEDAVAAGNDVAAVVGVGDTVIVNEVEAAILTGERDPGQACRMLAATAATAVVTLGARGALACSAGEQHACAAPALAAVDTLGAGDLFIAAYIWADLCGAALPERLQWAVLSASLSVRVPTTVAGAARLQELLDEGAARGLTAPVRARSRHWTPEEGEQDGSRQAV